MRGLVVPILLAGCAATPRIRVEPQAKARLLELASSLDHGDASGIERQVRVRDASLRPERTKALAPELKVLATELRQAAEGSMEVRARVQVVGPLGSEVRLDRDRNGWRVDPDSAGLPTATPRAAIEQLIVALDRLESDPALALLSRSLREEIIKTSRERADALRELLPRITEQADAQLPLHLDYGNGLFVLLKKQDGQWRVDDFN